MRIPRCALIAACVFITSIGFAQSWNDVMKTIPAIPREFRGVWIATVDNIDFPSSRNLPTDIQKQEITAILDQCVAMNINAVIFQVRTMCDAFYESRYEPWSAFLTGTMGNKPSPYYDPLQFIIEEGHKRALEVHAWFNPYRARHPGDKSNPTPDHISKAKPHLVKSYSSYLWLDPSLKEVQDHSMNVILDVVRRYDIDGVHIDDYFYPYKVSGLDFPDTESWQQYKSSGGTMSRAEWRRQAVNIFVERYYKEVKQIKPWVKVGISPFGIWRPGYPAGVVGMDQYNDIYADARLWLQKGWVDYFTPQLYWPIASSGQPYKKLLSWWVEQNTFGRHIWPGNFTSKYDPDEIIAQVKATREQRGATGNVHFSMKPFMQNKNGLSVKIKQSAYNDAVLIPASPWIDSVPPAKPTLNVTPERGSAKLLTVQVPGNEYVTKWIYYYYARGAWRITIIPALGNPVLTLNLTPENTPDLVAISAIDRAGNESERAMVLLKQ